MTTKNFRVRRGLTIAGDTTGTTSLAAANSGGDQNYTLPTALPTTNGYVLASQTDGTMSWADNTNTTYTIDSSTTLGGANLNLNGSDSTVDSVTFTGTTGVTVTSPASNAIDIAIGQPVAPTDTVQFQSLLVSGGTGYFTTDPGIAVNLYQSNISIGDGSAGQTGFSINGPAGHAGFLYFDSTTDSFYFDSQAAGNLLTLSPTTATLIGDLDVKGGDITNSTGALQITTASNGAITLAPNGTGRITLGSDIVNIGDGAATSELRAYTNTTLRLSAVETTSGATSYIDIENGANANIKIAPNGTGDVHIYSDSTRFGDQNAAATLTTYGTGDLIIRTNEGSAVEGSITLANGANGNMTLAPNGTGSVALTLANGGNLTNTRNYVLGTIRDTTTAAAGDIWSYLTGGALGVRGISLDNTGDTTKRPGMVLRSYGSTNARPFILGEFNRGTVASPLTTNSGNTLLEIDGSGYNGTQWATDAVSVAPIGITLQAAENWTTTANGSRLRVDAQPIGVSPTGLTRSNLINHTSSQATYRSDNWAFATREAGPQGGAGQTLMTLAVVGSGANAENTLNLLKTDATGANNQGVINFATYRSTGGTYSPTQSGDKLGQYKFNGNTTTGASPVIGASPAVAIGAVATQNWTASAQGTKLLISAVKNGGSSSVDIIDHAPTAAVYKADSFTFATSTGSTIVAFDSSGNLTIGGDLRINGNDIQASDGLTAITMVPITSNNPNTDFSGNIVKGAIRTGGGETNGNIYEFIGSTSPSTGISVDNTDKVADRTSIVLRNYGASLAGGLPRTNIVSEVARGTAASPTNIGLNDNLFEIQATGYTSAGWISDLVNAPPAIARFRAAEAFTNGLNNVGTTFQIVQQPTATTLTTGGASLVATFNNNPQNTNINSNFVNINQGKVTATGGSVLSMGGPGTAGGSYLQVGDVNIAQMSSSWQSALSPGFKYNGLASSVSGPTTGNGVLFEMSSRWKAASTDTAFVPPQSGWGLGAFQFSADASTTNTNQQLGGQIRVLATENWDATHYGTKITLDANKLGSAGGFQVASFSPETSSISTDALAFNDSSGSPLVGDKITYNRVYGQWRYATTISGLTANTAYVFPIGTADYNNIATVGSTSRIIPGATGKYTLQFGIQIQNGPNPGADAYIWLRKNGVDVSGSTQVFNLYYETKTFTAGNWMLDSANTSDYWEIAYAVSNPSITFPAYAATAFSPSSSNIVTTLTPVGI